MGFLLPDTRTVLAAGLVGFCGYGLSLVMFVLALRHLGTARTGAYFSAAPLVGAAISLVMLGTHPPGSSGAATPAWASQLQNSLHGAARWFPGQTILTWPRGRGRISNPMMPIYISMGEPVQKHAVMAVRYDRPLRDVERTLRHFRNYLLRQRKDYCTASGETLNAEEAALAKLFIPDLLHNTKPARAQESKKARVITIKDWVREAGFDYSIESIRKSCARGPAQISDLRALRCRLVFSSRHALTQVNAMVNRRLEICCEGPGTNLCKFLEQLCANER